MADLTDIQAAQTVKIAGANPASGVEDNYLDVDASGRIVAKLADASGSAITLGQTTMASSLPVTIASNQSALPVSQSGTWTTGRTWTLASGTDSVTSIQGTAAALSGKWPVQITDGTNTMPTMDVVGRAGFHKITDGTNTAAVKAASIAAVAADPALVVSISPNNVANATPWLVTDSSDGSVAPGTIATKSGLMGGQYSSTLPVLTNGQQAAIQVDSNGRILTSSAALPTAASKFSFGQLVTNTSVNYLPIEFTAYTEPTTNSAMTIVSASASDASAGTGARTVIVTYLDQTGAGPFTTSFTMNGTTPVTAGVSNMCFVEKITVATVGSTGSNVGIITLKTGGAVTVGTIAATNNQTFWAHHYVPTGLTCYISGFSFGNNSTAAGNGAQFILKSATPTIANTPEIQISDIVNVAGAASSDARNYLSPIQILGPARVRAFVLPYANAATTQFASFDFIDT